MNTHRRDFLREMSSVAALAASGSILKKDAESAAIHTSHLTGMYRDWELGALRDQFPILKERGQRTRLGLSRRRRHDPTSSGGRVISGDQANAGCPYRLRLWGTPWMIAAKALIDFWQIFGKTVF
jgi:hypothetical protein